jgi:ABC-type nickel/cobalt efflux system permease component RcnA
MDWLIAVQTWLYGGMAEQMRSAGDTAALPFLVATAFLFGVVHALMPGHGKSLLVSYHFGRTGRWTSGVATGALLALTHVGLAILLVLAGVAVISRTAAAGGRAPAFEMLSAVLIIGIGGWLLVRSLRMHAHQGEREGKTLALAAGMIPCPLTTFILIYAISRGQLAAGLAAVGGLLAGIMATLVVVAVTAIAAREALVQLLAKTEKARFGLGKGLEVASAAGVLVLGLLMLMRGLANA